MDIDGQNDTTLDVPLPEAVTTEQEPSPAETRPTIDDAIERAWAAHDRARDEAGRFAKAEQAGKPAADAKPVAPSPKPAVAQVAKPASAPPAEQVAPAAATPATTVPASWGNGMSDLWGRLPPEAQAKIAEREEQISRGFKRYEGLADFADIAERSGTTLREAMGRYRQYEVAMQQNPVGTLINLAGLYKVDPQQLAQAVAGAAQAQPQPAPGRQMPQPVDVRAEVRREFVQHDTTRQVADFVRDPANKHFETVADHVAALLRADRSLPLKDAYDQACWAHPQVRAQLLREQADKTTADQAKLQAEQAAKARAATQTAQRAAKSLVASPGARVNGAKRGVSIDDAISAAWDAHAG
jgi:hypothetical protein